MILIVLCLSVFGLSETEQKLLQKIEEVTGNEAQICSYSVMDNMNCTKNICYDSSETIYQVCH